MHYRIGSPERDGQDKAGGNLGAYQPPGGTPVTLGSEPIDLSSLFRNASSKTEADSIRIEANPSVENFEGLQLQFQMELQVRLGPRPGRFYVDPSSRVTKAPGRLGWQR